MLNRTMVEVVVRTVQGAVFHSFSVDGSTRMRQLHILVENELDARGEPSHAFDLHVGNALVTLVDGIAAREAMRFANEDGVIEATITFLSLRGCILNEREPKQCAHCKRVRPMRYCRRHPDGAWLCTACGGAADDDPAPSIP